MTDNPSMSLRDYFAAKFAAAMMTATSADVGFPRPELKVRTDGPSLAEHVATIAYQLADAMLKVRGVALKEGHNDRPENP